MAENQSTMPMLESQTANLFTALLDNLSTLMVSSDENVCNAAFDSLTQLLHQRPEVIEELIGGTSFRVEA